MKKKLMLGSLLALLSLGVALPVGAVANPERAEEIQTTARERAEARQQKREDRVAEIKTEVETRRATLKQEQCEAREAKLKERIPKLATSAKRLKEVIDRKYEQVQGFYESGKLTVSNYEELVMAIEEAKATSETSLEALESYEFEIDCEANGVAGQLDSYRTAVKAAREDLKAYRKALVELISSLRAAAAEENANDAADETKPEGSDEEGAANE